jgi:hypothetical protein
MHSRLSGRLYRCSVTKPVISRRENAARNRDIKITNASSENVTKFGCFRMTITIQIHVHEQVKGRLNSGSPHFFILNFCPRI